MLTMTIKMISVVVWRPSLTNQKIKMVSLVVWRPSLKNQKIKMTSLVVWRPSLKNQKIKMTSLVDFIVSKCASQSKCLDFLIYFSAAMLTWFLCCVTKRCSCFNYIVLQLLYCLGGNSTVIEKNKIKTYRPIESLYPQHTDQSKPFIYLIARTTVLANTAILQYR